MARRSRPIAATLLGLVLMMVVGAPGAAGIEPAASGSAAGPHSPEGRRRAPTTIRAVDGAIVRSVDLGDVDLGDVGRGRPADEYRAPVRGLLITPDVRGPAHARLLVLAHLRYPNCDGDRFRFPCPPGTERRLDKGMTYLGVALARRGYSVLIPDLGPLYIGQHLARPYDQRTGVRRAIGRLVRAAIGASAGRRTRFGAGLTGDIDASGVGLLAHSRSASVSRSLVLAWRHGAHPITSLLTYGGAYDVAYHGDPGTSPMAPDIPYLGIVGDQDRDTEFMAQLWLSHHVAAVRAAPALVGVIPGFGHTFINRTLSSAGIDDRICDVDCPSAAEHRRWLVATSATWFDATLRHRRTGVPIRSDDALPTTLAGVPARWLALTNARHVTAFLAGRRGTLRPVGDGATTPRTCFPPEPMAPSRPGTCPYPWRGVSQNADRVTQIRVAPASGVVLDTRPTRGVSAVVIHLAPGGDRRDRAAGSPLRVGVRLAGGRWVVRDIPADHPALADRASASTNGTYVIGTLRIPLPAWVARGRVVAVRLTGGAARSRFDVRAIDLVQARTRR